MGLRLFLHALGQVFNHLGAAFRIGGVLWIIAIALVFLLSFAMGFALADRANPNGAAAVTAMIVGFVLITAVCLWIAVAWHRYVLLDEAPAGAIPRFNGERVWAYFGRSLLLGIILLLIGMVVMIPFGFLVTGIVSVAPGPLGVLYASIPMFVAYVIIGLVGYRYSVVLPATAIGKPIGMGEAWEATSGASGAILALALLSSICVTGLDFATSWVAYRLPWWFGAPLQLVVTWFELMVGISIVTTLYGHYVERRPLASQPAPA